MLILEEFTNAWNYTFIIVMTFAIIIGTIITLRKMNKEENQRKRMSRSEKRKESASRNQ